MTKQENAEIVRGERDCPPSPSDRPWLLYNHGQDQTFYSLSRNRTYVRSVSELVSNKVWNSCHGWLILSTKDSQFFSLWNPISFETIRLPSFELDHPSCIESCVLSSPPGNPDSTVFLFDMGARSIWFCRLEYQKHRWFTHCYKEEIQALTNTETENDLYLPTCCDNEVYARTYLGRMVVKINISETHSLVLKPVTKCPYPNNMVTPCMGTYLIGSPGELFILYPLYVVFNGREEVVDIHIYKLDLSSMVWERVRSAKDRAFFFSEDEDDANSWSAICSEDTGNRIYFTRPNDKSLYTYHIEDKNLSISLPCPNLPASSEAPIWVIPNTRYICN